MAILKKSQILQGINDPKKVHIKSLDGELWMRPLSSAELDECDNIETKALGVYETNNKSKVQGRSLTNGESLQKGKVNVEKMNMAQQEATYTRIEKSLDNPKNNDDPWTIDDLKQLKRHQIEELEENVFELSGADITEKEIKDFPEDE